LATSFDEIYDLALVVWTDYKLNKLMTLDYPAFLIYMEGKLLLSVPDFNGCFKTLDYNLSTLSFTEDLDRKEKSILSKIIVYNLFLEKINDVTVFQAKLPTRDFKMTSEDRNLKEKSEYLDRIREKYCQEIVEYQLANLSKIPFFNGGV